MLKLAWGLWFTIKVNTMKRFTYTLLITILAALASCHYALAQNPNTIKQKCQSPYGSTYGKVQITSSGDINVNPCPTKSTTFTGTVILPQGGSPVSGTGSNNHVTRWTGTNTIGDTGLVWNGTIFDVQNTAGDATFFLRMTPSALGIGNFSVGESSTAFFGLSDSIDSATVRGVGGVGIDSGVGTTSITAAILDLSGSSNIKLFRTITAGGTTGNQTISKPNGSVNVAAGAASIVITNTLVTTSSTLIATLNTADATCTFVKSAVPTANTITVTLNAVCGAETRVAFWVFN